MFRSLTSGAALLLLGSCAATKTPVGAPPLPAPATVTATPAVMKGANREFGLSGEAQQGGVMRGTVPEGASSLSFNGEAIRFDTDGHFLIAFDRDAPTQATLEASFHGEATTARWNIEVKPGNWRIENVDASPTAGLASAEFLARRKGELERIAAARAVGASSTGWRKSFIWPATGRISGQFGAQRIYRGAPGSYHGGVDIAGGNGKAFVAPADGVVVLAAQEPFTLEGYLLIVDHGMGLNSAFLHCSSLAVKEGDVVHQGQVLGRIGATGRAKGAHLHWGMKWREARIDPAMLAGPMP